MKKIYGFVMVLFCLLLLTGCGKQTKEKIVDKIDKKINNSRGYKIDAQMVLINNEDTYKYDVTSSYKKKDYYRVSLRNKSNNHEQIILKNSDGVYVLTPNLNKSFKFQSKWPYNNSQSYLLQSIIKDMKQDPNLKMQKKNNKYIFTSKVNYKNNQDLTCQKIIFDNNLNIKEVLVYNKDGNVGIRVKFKNVDMNAKFNKNYFVLEENMQTAITNEKEEKTTTEEETEQESLLDEAVYPMYLPDKTYLDTEKTVDLENGSRVILTFKGDTPFMLVEEEVLSQDELEVIPTSGDLDILLDTVAVVSDTSVNWNSNGIEYYLVSSDMTKSELLKVAKSISRMPINK